jgi:hypothetical protein
LQRRRVLAAGWVAVETFGAVAGLVVVPAGEAAVTPPAGVGLEACADLLASCLAFCSEVATALWAFAIARERPSTPGAAPW